MLIDKVKKVKITDNITIGNDKIFLIKQINYVILLTEKIIEK